MISKTPKEKVVIPETHKRLLAKRKKGRQPRSYYKEVSSRQLKLKIPKMIWIKSLKSKITFELIPSVYLEIMEGAAETSLSYTNGSVVVTATKTSFQNKIEITEIYKCSLSVKEAKQRGIQWLAPSHLLFLDKRNHFLTRLQQRDFDLTLIVDAYIELKRVMPGDSVSVSDGTTKIIGRKLTGFSVLLSTGMNVGIIDWDDFLDKRFY